MALSIGVAHVVLCAGAGTRLRPVTERLPKALCTVGNRPLVDWALDSPVAAGMRRAANAHHLADQVVDHLAGRDVHVNVEQPVALGTAGALAALRPWLDGAGVLVQNADAWIPDPPAGFVAGWDRTRPRLLVRRTAATADFGTSRFLGLSLLPAALVARLRPEPTGLYEVMWREAWEAGELDLVEHHGVAFDVGTPARLLAANLCAGEGRSFVHPSAHVAAPLASSVALPGAVVPEGPEVRFSVCGPGDLRVACDPDVVREELGVGRGA
ncbi:MAG TPA: sugar phosphate nucleotidyltransferase [Nocardioides sp.]|nr:sugar phosphate nucleotidyltransferase [Nocardioides sp.]